MRRPRAHWCRKRSMTAPTRCSARSIPVPRIVNMLVAQQAGIPQFTGSEAPAITALGNPYIFRTSFGSQKVDAGKIALHAGRDEGQEGRDRLGQQRVRQGRPRRLHRRDGERRGIEVAADVPSENAQADFAADVVKIKRADAEAVFVYVNRGGERALPAARPRSRALTMPLVGEDDVDRPEGHRARRRRRQRRASGHVGLTPEAPIPAVKEISARSSQETFSYRPDHNAHQGLHWRLRRSSTRPSMVGELDRKALAEQLHGLKTGCRRASQAS